MAKDLELRKVYQQIQWWLKKSFGSDFEDLGCAMEHGIQRDSTSCAITAVNMLAHKALGDPLWNVSRKIFERVAWFNKLAKWQIILIVSIRLIAYTQRQLTFYQTSDPQSAKPAKKTGTMVIDDEESLKTNQGKSVSATPTSNQPERPRTDNMQIHLS
jgi:hypothetical protein